MQAHVVGHDTCLILKSLKVKTFKWETHCCITKQVQHKHSYNNLVLSGCDRKSRQPGYWEPFSTNFLHTRSPVFLFFPSYPPVCPWITCRLHIKCAAGGRRCWRGGPQLLSEDRVAIIMALYSSVPSEKKPIPEGGAHLICTGSTIYICALFNVEKVPVAWYIVDCNQWL